MTSAPAPPDRDEETMGWVAGTLYLIGAAVTVLAVLLPHSPRANVDAFWIMAVGVAAAAAVLLATAGRVPVGFYVAAMLLASVTITLALYFNGERLGGPSAGNEVLYVWVALYSGYFFSRRVLAAQLAALGGLYAGALALNHAGSVGPTRWLITMGMVCTAATLVHVLRLRNQRLVEQLHVAARTDTLTGLPNRQGFDELLERELARARRSGGRTSLIVADLDRFKDINDGFGHPAGDAALRGVGALARDVGRGSDVMARIGGDEFAAVLPDTGADGALAYVEQLRDAVTGLSDPGGRALTMSFGIVEAEAGEVSATALVHAADQALYRAKRLGKNQSIVTRGELPAAFELA